MKKITVKGKAVVKVPIEYGFEMTMQADEDAVIEEIIVAYLKQIRYSKAEVEDFNVSSLSMNQDAIEEYIRDESDDSELIDFKASLLDT